MNVLELKKALDQYPDELPVVMDFFYGSGSQEEAVGHVMDSTEVDQQGPRVILIGQSMETA